MITFLWHGHIPVVHETLMVHLVSYQERRIKAGSRLTKPACLPQCLPMMVVNLTISGQLKPKELGIPVKDFLDQIL